MFSYWQQVIFNKLELRILSKYLKWIRNHKPTPCKHHEELQEQKMIQRKQKLQTVKSLGPTKKQLCVSESSNKVLKTMIMIIQKGQQKIKIYEYTLIFYHQVNKHLYQFMLQISFYSWGKKNNQGLCDFKQISSQILKKITVNSTGIIYRSNAENDLKFVEIKNVPQKGELANHQALLSITKIEQNFKVTDLKDKDVNSEYLSIIAPKNYDTIKKQNVKSNIKITEGSEVKIGKAVVKVVKFKGSRQKSESNIYTNSLKLMEGIKKIQFEDYTFIKNTADDSNLCQMDMGSESQNYSIQPENPICKICYSRTFTEKNSLVSLCNCIGSSKYIHESCLKKWVCQRAQIQSLNKNNKKIVYAALMQAFQCQICKSYYPLSNIFQFVIHKNDFQKFKQYIVLQVSVNENKQLYIISLQQGENIEIGRDQQNDIIINDLTVSRKHSILLPDLNLEEIQIFDLNSTFGTSIKKTSIVLKQQLPIKLQKGRTYLELNKCKSKGISKILNNFLLCKFDN